MADDNTDTKTTLLSNIEELTGLKRDAEETAEDYKARIVRHFAEAYPSTDEGNAAFEKLDDKITDWVDTATTAYRDNRGTRNKKPLPELEGLAEDEKKAKPSARVSRGANKDDAKTDKKSTGRAFGAKKALATTFEPVPENAHVSKFLSKAFKAHGYKKQKDMSKSGHIVYANEAGHEVYVGPGKDETAYMMGWRGKEQKSHSYGGDDLDAYLSSR